MAGAFTAPVLIQPLEECENAIALCHEDAASVPFPCDIDGNPGGALACYDLVVIDSNACGTAPNALRQRRLRVWVDGLDTPAAALVRHEWSGARTPLVTTTGGALFGIEPTITRDGKLLVWQGHPQNDGQIDVLMYATNGAACAVDGWSAARTISIWPPTPA